MYNKVTIQISSGQGPDECELAVAKLYAALCEEFSDIKLISKSPGRRAGCYKSVCISGSDKLRELEGTVQWICKSPFRPNHKRKNWFIDVSVYATADGLDFEEMLVRFETFRSSGKGGQHVNKTESGVRAIYEPTGDSAISTDERSQHQNKKIAVERLKQQIAERNKARQISAENQKWLEIYRIERGNPVRAYKGEDFKLEFIVDRKRGG